MGGQFGHQRDHGQQAKRKGIEIETGKPGLIPQYPDSKPNQVTNEKRRITVDGVLVQIGQVPNTEYLHGIIPLNEHGQIEVNKYMESDTHFILAAGDIRAGSPRQIAAAVGDGAIAAIRADELLNEIE